MFSKRSEGQVSWSLLLLRPEKSRTSLGGDGLAAQVGGGDTVGEGHSGIGRVRVEGH